MTSSTPPPSPLGRREHIASTTRERSSHLDVATSPRHARPPDPSQRRYDATLARPTTSTLATRLFSQWTHLGAMWRGMIVALVVVLLLAGILLVRILDPDSAGRADGLPLPDTGMEINESVRGSETRDGALPPSPDPATTVTTEQEGMPATVHVVGAVAAPGIYTLTTAARVDAAIAAAGGAAENADISTINIARKIVDGEQIRVPAQGESPRPDQAGGVAGPEGSGSAAGAGAQVSLNQATTEQLITLPRIGPAMAARIIEWRTANGPFRSVADLSQVSGIGPKMIAALRGKVTV